jgi:hypothetical protein
VTVVGPFRNPPRWRTDSANQRGGSEWEPIKILLEGDGNSNKMNTASNTRLQLTTKVGQAHVATGVPLDLGTNTQPSDPRMQRNTKPRVHWPTPVRSVSTTGQTGPCWRELMTSTKWLHTSQAGATHRSDRSKPESPQITKHAYRPPNWPKLETAATQDNSKHTQTFTRAKTHQGLHRSDRSRHRSDRCSLGSSRWTTPAGQLPHIQTSISQIAPQTCTRLWG